MPSAQPAKATLEKGAAEPSPPAIETNGEFETNRDLAIIGPRRPVKLLKDSIWATSDDEGDTGANFKPKAHHSNNTNTTETTTRKTTAATTQDTKVHKTGDRVVTISTIITTITTIITTEEAATINGGEVNEPSQESQS